MDIYDSRVIITKRLKTTQMTFKERMDKPTLWYKHMTQDSSEIKEVNN